MYIYVYIFFVLFCSLFVCLFDLLLFSSFVCLFFVSTVYRSRFTPHANLGGRGLSEGRGWGGGGLKMEVWLDLHVPFQRVIIFNEISPWS